MRHVDFEVAYDGPYIPGAPPVSIDDLVVCEKCLETAGAVIGLTRADDVVADRDAQARRADDAEQHVSELAEFSAKLEDALSVRPAPQTVEVTVPDPAAEARASDAEAALAAAQARVTDLENELKVAQQPTPPVDPQPPADEREELQALLRAHGVEPDGRWGTQRLAQELEKALPADPPDVTPPADSTTPEA